MRGTVPSTDGLLRKDLDASARGGESRRRRAAARGRRSRLAHWLLGGAPHAPLPAQLGVLEEPAPGRYGICCSGGGIRSAAFNLGALQVLQAREHRVLQRATYLSAVSGGSYTAAGLAMVAQVDGDHGSDPELVNDDAPPFHPGSPEEQYLRNRSSYMAPGFAGKARLVARVVLGMLVNLLFISSVLFVAGWILGRVVYGEWLFPDLRHADGNAGTGPGAIISLAVVGLSAALGLIATVVQFRTEAPTRFLQAWAGRLLLAAVATALVLVAVPELIQWLRDVPATPDPGEARPESTASDLGGSNAAAAVGTTSAAALLLSILVQLRARMTDSRLLARAVESGRGGVSGYLTDRVLPRVRGALALVAAAIAGPLLFGGVLVSATLVGLVDDDLGGWTFPALAAAVLFAGALSLYGDVTSWSLHPFYRRQLSTAFALRRIRGRNGEPIATERDYDTPVPLSRSGVEPVPGEQKSREWPQLVICAAANVSDPGATPPGRAVTSFTFSPKVIGGPLIGTVATERFEEQLTERLRDFTLPAAVAMSGAALSPSMGKMTRWPLRFLMTLGNARLGVWVPNPRRLEDAERRGLTGFRRALYWRPRPLLLLNEMLGRNSADAKFLYVTDGGHYENLGLVELLRRGCLDVYCFDASGGRDIQELGDAIALARTELGVEVSISPQMAAAIVPNEEGMALTDCVTGAIHFPDGQVGKLVYVRSVLTAAAPQDVRAYHEVDPDFPHNSTGDQLYTDQRFEAYRALGRGAAERALTLYQPPHLTAGDGRRSGSVPLPTPAAPPTG